MPLFDVLGLLLFENLGLAVDDQECDFKLMTVHGLSCGIEAWRIR